MTGPKLRARLAAGEAVTMYSPHHATSALAVRLVELGADSVFLDCEHGTWSFEDVRVTSRIVRPAGGATIVRPHSHERPLLIRYLHVGADGLMVPMVDTAEQARSIVNSVYYAPSSSHGLPLVVVIIETLEAIANLGDLLEVDGIDVFFIGPGDLSQNMGYPPSPPFGEPRPAPVMASIATAVAKIRAAGKVAGTLVTADELPGWLAAGVQYFYIHTDPFLRRGMEAIQTELARSKSREFHKTQP